MKLGLIAGYSGKKISIPIDTIKKPMSTRLPFGVDGGSVRLRRDHAARVDAGADDPDQARYRHHADAGAHPGDVRDDGDDSRSLSGGRFILGLGASGAASRRGLARRAVRTSRSRARASTSRSCEICAREEPSSTTARSTRFPTRTGHDGPRQAAEEHPGLRGPMPIYAATIRPPERQKAAELADASPRSRFRRPAQRLQGHRRRGLPRRRAAARPWRTSISRRSCW